MKSFFQQQCCTVKVQCAMCRAHDRSGVTFRSAVVRVYDEPRELNFECPHGVEWGGRAEPEGASITYEEVKSLVDAAEPGVMDELKADLARRQTQIDRAESGESGGCSPCKANAIRRGMVDKYLKVTSANNTARERSKDNG